MQVNRLSLTTLLAFVLLTSCAKSQPDASTKAATVSNKHTTYTCPMHPEVVQEGPGDCPKCGMSLVAAEEKKSAPKVKMDYSTTPSSPIAGKPTLLKLVPKSIEDGSTVKDIAVVHEKPMHLMIMSRDLKLFDHVHPDLRPDGSFLLPYTFPVDGNYVLWSEIEERDESTPQHFRMEQQVGATTTAWARLTPSAAFTAEKYAFVLSTDGQLVAGKSSNLKVHITHANKLVTNLGSYLGALGHMTIVSEDTKIFLHAHPQEDSHASGESATRHTHGPDVEFMTLFDEPGSYKLWAQFNIDGKIRTAEFVVNVIAAH